MEEGPVSSLVSKDAMTQNFPFPAPSLQPSLGLEALILSPYWALICADGQLLAPSSQDSGNSGGSVASAVGLWVPLPVGC